MDTEKQPDSISIDDSYFIKNAMACFMHHYPKHKFVAIYQELIKKEYIEKPEPKPARKKAAANA